MPTISVQLETPLRRSFRVEQVAGMFDVPVEERLRHELVVEVPGMEEEWTIGAIVGPSGSGKTTLARAAFGEAVYEAVEWPSGVAVVEALGDVLGDVGARGSGFGVKGSLAEKFPLVPSPESRTPCLSIREITRVLCGVGLGSVPTWLKPYEVLSTGEKFRADLARAVVGRGSLTRRRGGTEEGEASGAGIPACTEYSVQSTAGDRDRLVVFDEFTSSLDRIVAKTTSAAVGRLLRGGMVGRRSASLSHPTGPRFVAVTCHDDVLPWLAPDWTLRLGGNGTMPRLTRQRPAQPSIELKIGRVPQAAWKDFAPHHYLAGRMAASATCYAARWEEELRTADCGLRNEAHASALNPQSEIHNPKLMAFCAVVAALGWKKTKRIARLVVLPEFQGMGVGGQVLDMVAGEEARKGNRVSITASHPAVLAHCSKSERWRLIGVKKNGSTRQRMEGREVGSSAGRAVVAFEFLGTAPSITTLTAQATFPTAQLPVPSPQVSAPNPQVTLNLSPSRRHRFSQLTAGKRLTNSGQKKQPRT